MIGAWKSVRGTALRPAVIWSWIAWTLAMIAQAVAWSESVESGRPWSGHWTYLATLATLATLLTVFNARKPGGGAWAILMAVLVLVLLIPWLEATGLARVSSPWDRLRLEAPWTGFFGLLAFAATTNYLPTRLCFAAIVSLAGFAVIGWGMTSFDRVEQTRETAWTIGLWSFAFAILIAHEGSRRKLSVKNDLDRAWFWFRDRWGVVWSLRVLERFNETALALNWPIRLSWQGVLSLTGNPLESADLPESAVTTFVTLLRRFADQDRILKDISIKE
ncbi:MAG: hypothetical protein NVSMB14_17640 [Isosphaeraceae bacterium]